MAIVIRSGLLAATKYVAEFLAANGLTTTVKVGWKERAKQINQGGGRANRVVFIPSDPSGKSGSLTAPHFAGDRDVRAAIDAPRAATMRELAGWNRIVTVSVWACDGEHPEDEEAQIEALETLFEWTVRAVHSAPGAFANAQWGDVTCTPIQERQFGRELLVGLTFRQPLFDQPREVVYPTGFSVSRA